MSYGTLISTVTVGAGGAASIAFTSIPQTFTDLLLVLSLRANDTGTSWIGGNLTINGVTTNQTERYLYGNGSTASSTSASTIEFFANSGSSTANTFGNASIYIPNYASTTTNKSYSQDLVTENNSATAFQLIHAGLWSSTAAITSLSYALPSNNLVQYSTASLYGIK